MLNKNEFKQGLHDDYKSFLKGLMEISKETDSVESIIEKQANSFATIISNRVDEYILSQKITIPTGTTISGSSTQGYFTGTITSIMEADIE